MAQEPLKGFTFIDLSTRLPGPLAGNLIGGLGAKVIKIEDLQVQDPFNKGLFSEMDECFKEWYSSLNNKKEILRFDFKSKKDIEKIHELVKKSDGVIMGLPPKVKKALKLTNSDLELYKKPLCIIDLKASKTQVGSMHELNALALSGMLKLYVDGRKEKTLRPPFLPFAGISFGQKVGMDLLAGTLQAQREEKVVFISTYLFETNKEVFQPFWTETLQKGGRTKFLHSGLYPCYCLYRTKDNGYVALAAVEKKFWLKFCELFNLDIPLEQRFEKGERIFNKVSNLFLSLSKKEISDALKGNDICLSLV